MSKLGTKVMKVPKKRLCKAERIRIRKKEIQTQPTGVGIGRESAIKWICYA